MTRLRRQLLGAATVLLAIGAGWLGIITRPYLGQIFLTAIAAVLLWLVTVSVIAFFRGR